MCIHRDTDNFMKLYGKVTLFVNIASKCKLAFIFRGVFYLLVNESTYR